MIAPASRGALLPSRGMVHYPRVIDLPSRAYSLAGQVPGLAGRGAGTGSPSLLPSSPTPQCGSPVLTRVASSGFVVPFYQKTPAKEGAAAQHPVGGAFPSSYIEEPASGPAAPAAWIRSSRMAPHRSRVTDPGASSPVLDRSSLVRVTGAAAPGEGGTTTRSRLRPQPRDTGRLSAAGGPSYSWTKRYSWMPCRSRNERLTRKPRMTWLSSAGA